MFQQADQIAHWVLMLFVIGWSMFTGYVMANERHRTNFDKS